MCLGRLGVIDRFLGLMERFLGVIERRLGVMERFLGLIEYRFELIDRLLLRGLAEYFLGRGDGDLESVDLRLLLD